MIFVASILGLDKNTKFLPLRNNILIILAMSNMLMYSARNSNVNNIAEYSTLNPDTNSDSLSVKSNGVRLVSAILLIVNIINIGSNGNIYHILF